MKRSTKLIVFMCAVAALSWVVWDLAFGWPPTFRTAGYFRFLEDFKNASVIDGAQQGWSFQGPAGAGVVMSISAPEHMGVVTVKYSDEGKPRELYEYHDYSSPVGLKRSGNILYIHWVETLFRTDHWILAYDLLGRKEIGRRRVAPKDIVDDGANRQ